MGNKLGGNKFPFDHDNMFKRDSDMPKILSWTEFHCKRDRYNNIPVHNKY